MESRLITCAPMPLILLDSEGKEHEFSATPLSDRDFDELDSWVQSKVLSVARASLTSDTEITVEQYRIEMAIAATAAIGVSLYDINGSAAINTPAGIGRLAWQMTKREHQKPKLSFDHFSPFCRRAENQSTILSVFSKQNTEHLEVSDNGKDDTEGTAKNAEPS